MPLPPGVPGDGKARGATIREPGDSGCLRIRTSGEETRREASKVSERSFAGYPFAGIVGMTDLKLALLLNAVAPAIGGVLVRGEKGTAKSTVVRGLAVLLPPVHVVAGCRYACDPLSPDPSCPSGPHPADAATDLRPATLAELPVGATEDRLVGSLDIERVLTSGVTAFQPGLLASAHRGLLYVDEVNLLHDHLVDLLLDAAALGVNYVEREGVSVRHASRFLLVGTMNPEEGELRPQLLDRFGLTVEVAASRDPAERAEVVRRRLSFEADPEGFAARFATEGAALAARVVAARARLPEVVLPDAALRQICAVCGAFGVDGMRADLVTARTAMALAAWLGRDVVTTEDVRAAARLALPHRRRRDPFDAPGLDEQALDEALRQTSPGGPPPDDNPGGPGDGPGSGGPGDGGPSGDGPSGGGPSGGPGSSADAPAPASRNGSSSPAETAPSSVERTAPDGSPEPAPASAASRSTRSSAAAATRPSDSAGLPPTTVAPTAPFRARLLTVPGVGEGAPGRRSAARGPSGRTVGARLPATRPFPLHLPATIRAAALAPPPATRPFRHPAVPASSRPEVPAVSEAGVARSLDPVVPASSRPEVPAASQADVAPSLDPGVSASSRPEVPAVSEAGVARSLDPVVPASFRPEVPAASQAGVAPSLDPGVSASSRPEVPAVSEAGVARSLDPVVPASFRPEVPAASQAGVAPSLDSGVPAASRTEVPAASQVGVPASSRPDVPAASDAGVAPNSHPGVLPASRADVPAASDAGVAPNPRPGVPAASRHDVPAASHAGVAASPDLNVSSAQSSRLERGGGRLDGARRPLVITAPDLREAIREGREGNLVLFVVDASGSMAAGERMRAVKGAILSLLLDAYQRRDKVGLVTFRGRSAELVLPPTSSVEIAARRLTTLATGGRTPLAAGLAEGARTLANERLRDPRRRALLVLVTDGRATVGTGADLTRSVAMLNGAAAVVIDCESSPVRLGLSQRVAVMLGAPVFGLDDLRAIATTRRAA